MCLGVGRFLGLKNAIMRFLSVDPDGHVIIELKCIQLHR